MNFELERLTDYSKQSLLNELRRVAKIVEPKPLTKKLFNKHGRASSSTITNNFSDWPTALEEAGLSDQYSGRSITTKQRSQRSKKLSNQEILNEIISIAKSLNTNTLTVDDIKSNSEVLGVSILRSRFGSPEAAILAAGLKISNYGKRYSDKDCFENLLEVWTNLGRQPSYQEMKTSISKVGAKAYINRWGTWLKACQAFVDFTNSENESVPLQELEVIPSKVKKKVVLDKDKREIKLGLRFRVLVESKFKCCKCGDSPATNLNCKLHVDHIIPFSKGGKTVYSNLQSLCENCNLGKGNRYKI